MGRIHVRTALVALIALVAIGTGTAFAATRTTSHPIGTGAVVIETNLAYQNAPRRARDCAYVIGKDLDQQSRDRRCDDDPGGRPKDDAHLHGAGRRL